MSEVTFTSTIGDKFQLWDNLPCTRCKHRLGMDIPASGSSSCLKGVPKGVFENPYLRLCSLYETKVQ